MERMPILLTVLRVVSKFVEHGTVQDRLKTNCGRKKTVQVPRNVGIIARQTPTLSIRRLHLGTELRRSSVEKMLRKTLKIPEPTCFDGMHVMVWAGLIKDHIIGPFFITGSVTGQVYLQLLQQRVWPALQAIMGEEEEFVVFQHDGASAHYETRVRAWLDGKLEDRWMGRGGPIPWPARSPDLSPLDFWL
eukprot:Em0008g171a